MKSSKKRRRGFCDDLKRVFNKNKSKTKKLNKGQTSKWKSQMHKSSSFEAGGIYLFQNVF
jgi:hypothetical protein